MGTSDVKAYVLEPGPGEDPGNESWRERWRKASAWRARLPNGTLMAVSEFEHKVLTDAAPRAALGGMSPPVRAILAYGLERDGHQLGPTLHCEDGSALQTADGINTWWRFGRLHRDGDLPAIEVPCGERFWYVDGKRHRDDDHPASIFADGTLEWNHNGLTHRTSGPARVSGSNREWWLSGINFDQQLNRLADDLAKGGRLISIVNDRHADGAPGRYRIVSLDGERLTHSRQIRCVGWLRWVIANADQHYPELAAAMRAIAMRGAMTLARDGVMQSLEPRPPARMRRGLV